MSMVCYGILLGPELKRHHISMAKYLPYCSMDIGFMASDAISSCTYIYAEIDIDDPYLDRDIIASLLGKGGGYGQCDIRKRNCIA